MKIMVAFVWIIPTVLLSLPLSQSFNFETCHEPLGMQSGSIPDDALSASSSYDDANAGPENARMRNDRRGDAWCPRKPISATDYEWIEVDLESVKVITEIETQGRLGNGQEFAEAYFVDYQRSVVNGGQWVRFRDHTATEMFMGNTNSFAADRRPIVPPIIARRLRIVPYSNHPRSICLRLELYGCLWTVGLLSYSMPQGETRGFEVDLFDHSYDGRESQGYLSGGLGQLTDGSLGHSNFRMDLDGLGRKGYEWVGWKNDTVDRPPVQILFEFNGVKNFSSIRLHSNNMFSKEVRAFRRISLYFGTSAGSFEEWPVVHDTGLDTDNEEAHFVTVPIEYRIGRYVKAELYFAARWLMISEIQFQLTEVSEAYHKNAVRKSLQSSSSSSSSSSPSPSDLLSGQTSSTAGIDDPLLNGSESSIALRMTEERLIAIVTGCLMAMALLLLAIVLLVAIRSRKASAGLNSQHNLVAYNNHGISPSDASSISPPENKSEEDDYREPADSIQWQDLPQQPSTTTDDCSDVTSSNYATPLHSPWITSTTALTGPAAGRLGHPSKRQPPALGDSPPPLPPPPVNHPAQWTGTDVYIAPDGSDVLESVDEIDRWRIRYIEQLDQGSFGEICLCEMLPSSSSSSSSSDLSEPTTTTTLVVVKTFIPSATVDENARDVFYREANVLRRLKTNANIVRLVGVIRQAEQPLCIVTEFLPLGDLQRFLQRHLRHSTGEARWSQTHGRQTTLSYGCLIYLASQIASAMRYLETLRLVHCSLACRKCLVGDRFLVKVSDFALTRCLPTIADYFRVEKEVNRKTTIRWMAWEAILHGRFSVKSDVWSFAVVLWEILTFGSALPFSCLTEEQVVDNARHFSDPVAGRPVHLDRPSLCPREVFDLMVQCWNSVEAQRPNFAEIHVFLTRKNAGYSVDDDLALQNLVTGLDLNDEDLP